MNDLFGAYVSRSMFTNICFLYSNVLFLSHFSGSEYSKLIMWINLVSFFGYSFLLFYPHFQKSLFLGFNVVLAAVMAVVGLSFDLPMVFGLSLMIGLVDGFGLNLYPILIQARVGPAGFANEYARFNSQEILGKFVGSSLILGLSTFERLDWILPLLGILFVVHAIFFLRAFRPSLLDFESHSKVSTNPVGNLIRTIDYLKGSLLLQAAVGMIIFFQVSKLFVDLNFFYTIESAIPEKKRIAQMISSIDLVMNLSSVLASHWLTPRVLRSWSLSFGLAVLPTALLVIGASSVFIENVYFATGTYFAFYVLFRSIHRPLNRQCLVPVPQELSRQINLAVTILTSLSNAFFGFMIYNSKAILDVAVNGMLLLFVNSIALVLIPRLDTLYVRNMWRSVRGEFDLPEPKTASARAEGFLPALSSVYAHAFDRDSLHRAVKAHAVALSEVDRWDRLEVWRLVTRLSPRIQSIVSTWLKRAGMWSEEFKLSSSGQEIPVCIRNLDLVAQLRWRRLHEQAAQKEDDRLMLLLHRFDQHPQALIQDLLEVLSGDKSRIALPYIKEAIDSGQFSLKSLLENLHYLDFLESMELLELISDLAKHGPLDVERYVVDEFESLLASGFRITAVDVGLKSKALKALYLSETLITPKSLSRRVRGTVKDLLSDNLRRRNLALELHRRHLNSSHVFRRFSSLLA